MYPSLDTCSPPPETTRSHRHHCQWGFTNAPYPLMTFPVGADSTTLLWQMTQPATATVPRAVLPFRPYRYVAAHTADRRTVRGHWPSPSRSGCRGWRWPWRRERYRDEQPVFSAHGEGPDGILGQGVADAQPSISEVTGQQVSLVGGVGDGFAGQAVLRHPGQVVLQPDLEVFERGAGQRLTLCLVFSSSGSFSICCSMAYSLRILPMATPGRRIMCNLRLESNDLSPQSARASRFSQGFLGVDLLLHRGNESCCR